MLHKSVAAKELVGSGRGSKDYKLRGHYLEIIPGEIEYGKVKTLILEPGDFD